MIKIKDIKAALIAVLTSMTTPSYATVIASGNIYKSFNQKFIAATKDSDYPKLVLITESGTTANLPGNSQSETLNFNIVFIDKDKNNNVDLAGKLDDFIEDIRKLMQLNSTLSDTVMDASMTDYKTDAGYLSPEGAVVINIAVERRINEVG